MLILKYDVIHESCVFIRRMIFVNVYWTPLLMVSTRRYTGWLNTINQEPPSPFSTDPYQSWRTQNRGKSGRNVCCTTTSVHHFTIAAFSCTALRKTSETAAGSDSFPDSFPIWTITLDDFHIQILKEQQCTVSRKENANVSSEINSRPIRLKKPDFSWSLYSTTWFPNNVVLRHC